MELKNRKIIDNEIIWFNSKGKDENGNKIPIDGNFSSKQQGVCDCLIQQLQVIKNELWYNISFGMPILEKNKSKIMIDSFVIKTINSHSEVKSILEFNSKIENHKYACKIKILSNYGEIDLTI